MEQMLLEGGCDCRLARGRKTREPDGKPALGPQPVPLVPRERRVPGNVSTLLFSYIPSDSGPPSELSIPPRGA